MKARLAKKLAHTPIDRLAPYWINKFVCKDGRDARFEKKKHLPSGGRETMTNKLLTKIYRNSNELSQYQDTAKTYHRSQVAGANATERKKWRKGVLP